MKHTDLEATGRLWTLEDEKQLCIDKISEAVKALRQLDEDDFPNAILTILKTIINSDDIK